MLELREIAFTAQKDQEELKLLEGITLRVPNSHFAAIVGPSGCGKTTLLKTIAGINLETAGDIYWDQRNLSDTGDLEPQEFGYVPQFSIAYDALTVEESVDSAVRLRVRTRSNQEVEAISDRILDQVGLDALRESRVSVLSGGQKRRLGLALELPTNPRLLLCDEVTSGLDPKSETEIVHLLHNLANREERIVLSVTHSLGNLELYDSVIVLYAGRLVYHGPPRAMTHYFGVPEAEDIYPALAKREPEAWAASWEKYRPEYYASMKLDQAPSPPEEPQEETPPQPSPITQLVVLMQRRWTIFFRDRTQLLLQIAMLLIFPCVVVLFAVEGIPALKRPSETLALNPAAELVEQMQIQQNRMEAGSLITGLIMFQVILLALMGSNNSAREIAGERQIFEKEKLGGLSSISYFGSKLTFLGVLVLAQSLWMYLFVSIFAQIPSQPLVHAGMLVLVNAAMTSICLGISASMRSPDQASLMSIYLVGFQLPLSGAILALPSAVEPFVQPFISAYWSWSGVIESVDSRYLAAAKSVTDATLQSIPWCLTALFAHLAAGMILTLAGIARSRWTH